MKIVIDVDKLLHEGRINREEYDRLKSLAAHETGSLAFNILIAFGVVATAGGVLAYSFRPARRPWCWAWRMAAAGVVLSQNHKEEWGLLGTLLLLVGAITTSGGLLFLTNGSLIGFITVAALARGRRDGEERPVGDAVRDRVDGGCRRRDGLLACRVHAGHLSPDPHGRALQRDQSGGFPAVQIAVAQNERLAIIVADCSSSS